MSLRLRLGIAGAALAALENLLDGNPFTNCFAVARPMPLLSQVTSAISFQLYPYIFSLVVISLWKTDLVQ